MPNRLADESSAYLLQHKDNPVDWYPWGPEALERAAAEDRPILLSVGYSACHWCHVMERESFEDPSTAEVMNAHFVNIKVDREERPDLDEIYMRAVQAFNRGRGGWPMTVFLTPEGEPFWGGTYFPPAPRQGMPSFKQVLAEMSRLWTERREQVSQITADMVQYLERTSQMPPPQGALRSDWLERVAVGASQAFDAQNGGFGGAPKFPSHGLLPLLLAHWRVSGAEPSLQMVTRTLDAMAQGGVYDLLAGGFARYSVDASWIVPHFEKMLYDNAQLIPIYVDAHTATGSARYARVVRESVGWMLREMRVEGGAFAASTDADSEGVEGRYFAWTPAEMDAVLGTEDGPVVAGLLGVSAAGSFEHGTSVLRLARPIASLEVREAEVLEAALPRLLAARSERVPPARDDKVVVSWNGLAISALARAGVALGEADWVDAAQTAARFLLDEVRVDGRLMRTWKDGRTQALACADDHANLLAAMLDLWEATFDQRWLIEANALADRMVDLFWDEEGGGLFFTGRDAPALVTRSKNLSGGSEPSANGVAALCFVRLDRLCGRTDLGDRARVVMGGLQPTLVQQPMALGVEGLAGHWLTRGGMEVGIAGDASAPDGAALLGEVRRRYLPFAVVAVRPADAPYDLLPWMLGKRERDGATAYLCEGYRCSAPTRDAAVLGEQLDDAARIEAVEPEPLVRVRAPELSSDPANWLNTDAPLTLERLRGRVVVLDFWTHCCINCLHLLPVLAEVEARFADAPVVVIGVHAAKFDAEKQGENVQAAIARHGIRHPVMLDPEHERWSAYAVRSWPTVAIVDPTGRVAWQRSGELTADVLGAAVQGLLDEGQASGTLGTEGWTPASLPQTQGSMSFPGKLSVWPTPSAQGEDPWAGEVCLYVSDSGNDRVIACTLSLGPDGWPVARWERSFDGFRDPQGTARYGDRLYVADTGNHQVRSVDLSSGEVSVLAGTGRLGAGGPLDPDAPLRADLRSPWDVEVSGDGAEHVLLVAMAGSHQIWVHAPAVGRFGPLAGSGREDHVDGGFAEAALAQPSGMVLHGQYLFFADSEVSSVRALDLGQRQVATLVGGGLFDFGDVDGAGAEVRLQHPLDVTAQGNTVFVADTYNNKIKAIDLHGAVTRTLVGGDGTLWEPAGIDRVGAFLFVADTNHHRVLVVRADTGAHRPLSLVEAGTPGDG